MSHSNEPGRFQPRQTNQLFSTELLYSSESGYWMKSNHSTSLETFEKDNETCELIIFTTWFNALYFYFRKAGKFVQNDCSVQAHLSQLTRTTHLLSPL